MYRYIRILGTLIFSYATLSGCSKKEFLNAKPSDVLVIPQTLRDMQYLLDNVSIMNGFGIGLYPGLGEASSDNYYLNQDQFISDLSDNPVHKEIYTWGDNIFNNPESKPEDWGFSYRCIFYSNVVLETLSKITIQNEEKAERDNIEGAALFYRAFAYFQLMQVFAPHYNKLTANSDLGVPLRLIADVSEPSKRETVELVYQKIISDLDKASKLLVDLSTINTRPSKAAVYGLLSRLYLVMGNYGQSLLFSNKCLELKSDLLDFNEINSSEFYPFNRNNKEILFFGILSFQYIDVLNSYFSRVDSTLYVQYLDDDLRKKMFFEDASVYGIPNDHGVFFRGSYDGTDQLFGGIAIDEIVLNKAECLARLGDYLKALEEINRLLKSRWSESVPYTPLSANSALDALNLILLERRKELIFRGLRWSDLRRLNSEGANISIKRVLNGQQFELPYNSLHYTLLIPQDVINFNPGMPQNKR